NPAVTPLQFPTPDGKKRHAQILERVKKGPVDLIFLGDSITQGWGGHPYGGLGQSLYKARYEPLNAANLGVGGEQTQHAGWRITRGGELKGPRAKLAVLMRGINTRASGHKPEQVAEGHAALIKATQANHAGTRVLLMGTLPAKTPKTKKQPEIDYRPRV